MEGANQNKPARPILVWLISVGYAIVAVGGLANITVLVTGAAPVPEPYGSDLSRFPVLYWAPAAAGSLLMFMFSVALFRLRASAVRWCEALLALSFGATALQLGRLGIPAGTLGRLAVASTTFSLSLLLAIYLYSRSLRSRALLT